MVRCIDRKFPRVSLSQRIRDHLRQESPRQPCALVRFSDEQIEEMEIRPHRGDSSDPIAVFGNIEPKISRETLLYFLRRMIREEACPALGRKFADDEFLG